MGWAASNPACDCVKWYLLPATPGSDFVSLRVINLHLHEHEAVWPLVLWLLPSAGSGGRHSGPPPKQRQHTVLPDDVMLLTELKKHDKVCMQLFKDTSATSAQLVKQNASGNCSSSVLHISASQQEGRAHMMDAACMSRQHGNTSTAAA